MSQETKRTLDSDTNGTMSVYVCPHCMALCLEGHDEDFQQNCANCGTTFDTHYAKHRHIDKEEIQKHYVVSHTCSQAWTSYVHTTGEE